MAHTRHVMLALLVMLMASPAVRAEELAPDNLGEPRVALDPDETHPIFSINSHWVESLSIACAGLFLAAAVIGPIVRAEAPEAVPPAMSHEEDPAVDRH
jgi:hypothetical protein